MTSTPAPIPGLLLTSVSSSGFAVGFSKLSDIYGRKNILAVAWLLFTLGSVWCGIARRMGELYVFPWEVPAANTR
jgi:MFS family permease